MSHINVRTLFVALQEGKHANICRGAATIFHIIFTREKVRRVRSVWDHINCFTGCYICFILPGSCQTTMSSFQLQMTSACCSRPSLSCILISNRSSGLKTTCVGLAVSFFNCLPVMRPGRLTCCRVWRAPGTASADGKHRVRCRVKPLRCCQPVRERQEGAELPLLLPPPHHLLALYPRRSESQEEQRPCWLSPLKETM